MGRKPAPGKKGGAGAKSKVAVAPLRVLVVEDHLNTRIGLKLFLEMLGYKLRFAVDVASALAAAGEAEFDALVSDIGLPDGTGWDLLRELDARRQRPRLAVAMSGFNTERDLTRSREAGFSRHLVKPFSPEELETVLASAVRRR